MKNKYTNKLEEKITEFLEKKDEKSFTELYEPLKLWASNVIRKYNMPYDESSMSWAFETAYFKINQVDLSKGSFKNWFFTIYKNDVMTKKKLNCYVFVSNYYNALENSSDSFLHDMMELEEEELVKEQLSSLLDLAEDYIQNRSRTDVIDAKTARAIVKDIIIDELSFEEVALKYSLSEGTVKSFIFYVRNYIMHAVRRGNYCDTIKGYAANRKLKKKATSCTKT